MLPSSRVRLLGLLVFPLLLLGTASRDAKPRAFDRIAAVKSSEDVDGSNDLDVSLPPKGRELLQEEVQVTSNCTTGSPLATAFADVTSIIQVSDSASLNTALLSLNKPTIINLAVTGSYTLNQEYGVQYNLCIQVNSPWMRVLYLPVIAVT